MKARVDIAVACAPNQVPGWWTNVMGRLLREQQRGIEIGNIHAVGSALPDHNKNHSLEIPAVGNPTEKRRGSLTDANRVVGAHSFLQGKSDWVMWLDDDTVPPEGFISRLLEAGRAMVAGLYFNAKPPYNPIAYLRRADGLYDTLDYTRGALMQVDSVGMGCTLIHKSVYEKIMAGHTLYQRGDGTLFPVPNEMVKDRKFAREGKQPYVRGGYLHQPVYPVLPDDNRPWPFYALEYMRTEDHYFCELAANVGERPWVDTTVECEHLKMKGTGRADYEQARKERATDE